MVSVDNLLPEKGIHNKIVSILLEVQDVNDPTTPKEVTDKIMAMLQSLRETQSNHEAIAKKMQVQCTEEENYRKKEVADAQAAYNAAAASYSKCQGSLTMAKANLPNLQRALTDFKNNLATKQKIRDQQHALYVQRLKDLMEAVQFLKDFMGELNSKLKNYPRSFVEITEKLLKHVSKIGKLGDAMGIFVALAAEPVETTTGVPTTQSNYSYIPQGKMIQNVVVQINKLTNSLMVDIKSCQDDENRAQAAFDKVKRALLAIISRLTNDITKTNTQINNMNACIKNEGAIMATANNKSSRNGKLGALAAQTCTDFAKEFVEATKNRLREMEVISTILNIVKKRFGELDPELVAYLESCKSTFKAYINSTPFQKYVAYVEKHIADNKHGADLSAPPPTHK